MTPTISDDEIIEVLQEVLAERRGLYAQIEVMRPLIEAFAGAYDMRVDLPKTQQAQKQARKLVAQWKTERQKEADDGN